MKTRYSAHSDVGRKREVNQDAYAVEPADLDAPDRLLVVCDGMGGHAAGEVASELGTRTIVEHYCADPAAPPESLLNTAFNAANQQIYTQGHGTMGTTGIAALIRGDRLHIANVGDSRAYLVRDGTIRQLSRDHSLVSDQIAAGLMTVEQARASSFRNVITRALGHLPNLSVDHFVETLYPRDIIILSTDGMHGLIEDDEILAAFKASSLDEAVTSLIDLANQRGGPDNITVAAAQTFDGDDLPAISDDFASYTAAELAAPTETAEPATAEPTITGTDAAETGQPAPAGKPIERPLSRNGLVLAGLLLLLITGAGAFFLLNRSSSGLPEPTTTATASASATATASASATATAPTSTIITAPTPGTTPEATVVPQPSPESSEP